MGNSPRERGTATAQLPYRVELVTKREGCQFVRKFQIHIYVWKCFLVNSITNLSWSGARGAPGTW
ncbi:hypothetical protein GBAR_LOCUS2813 [Geodia barretti]|uniref:Uncharacterized protein n=1 Tax=Geodia barretti TaxID=519541 RepID=A0AA35W5G5_GEOBA|nr:hypothetical protein GBAR_LOCUS2813 [Geodia barretti]